MRVTAPSLGLVAVTGILAGRTERALRVDLDAGVGARAIDRADISELEVWTGRRNRAGTGLAVGFLVGAGIGALAGLADEGDESAIIDLSPGERAALGSALFGVVGAVAGFVVGWSVRSDVWTPVPLSADPGRPAPFVGASGSSLRLGFRLTVG